MAEEKNNSVDLSNLSVEQIKEMYKDIVEFPDDQIAAVSTCGKGVISCSTWNPSR